MLNRLSWFLAYRYLNSKYTNSFVSFITIISTIGVALGTAILIIVLSVLNGFKEHIENQLLEDQPHIIIEHHSTANNSELINQLNNISTKTEIKSKFFSLIKENGLLKARDAIMPINIISEYDDKIKKEDDTIRVSRRLSQRLKLNLGDKIILAAPVLKDSIIGPQPRFKRFVINNIFDDKSAISRFKDTDVILSYKTALTFFNLPPDYLSGIYIFIDRPLFAEQLKQNIINSNDFNSLVKISPKITTWYDFNRTLFQAIKIERIAIILLLLIIITVAAFNLISGLYIQVSEKQKDMAILRTYGVKGKQISSIFIIQGIIIGIVGGSIGTFFGVLISYNLDYILNTLKAFGLLNTDNLFLTSIADNYIIITPDYHDVLLIAVSALIICIIFTILPAYRASKILPIEALKHE